MIAIHATGFAITRRAGSPIGVGDDGGWFGDDGGWFENVGRAARHYGVMNSYVSSGYISPIRASTPMPPTRKILPSGNSVAE